MDYSSMAGGGGGDTLASHAETGATTYNFGGGASEYALPLAVAGLLAMALLVVALILKK